MTILSHHRTFPSFFTTTHSSFTQRFAVSTPQQQHFRSAHPTKMTKHNPQPLRERFPALDRSIPEWLYNALIAILSEFLGTTFFLFFVLAGCQVAYTHLSPSTVIFPGSPARPSGGQAVSSASLLYAALSVGFSMMVNAWIFFRISSGLFNPSITLGMVVEGSLGWKKGVTIAVAQFAGGMAAGGLVSGLFPGQLKAETLLVSGTSITRGLFIELLLTAAFVFSVFMLATEKHKNTSPVGIGLALFIAQLVGGPFTGASLNPARSFGAAVAAHHFPGYHWIYWLGPLLGSLLAVGFYKVARILEVETALVVQGGNSLDRDRGMSNASNNQADAAPTEVRVLDPVAKSDLEKGLKAPGEASSATGLAEHAQR